MLILASDGNNLYTELENIKRMYIHKNKNIEAFFYKSNPDLSENFIIQEDIIYVKTMEVYPQLWKKFWLVLKALEHRLDEFDFICRPNISTFIILERYLQHVDKLPSTKCCSGVVHFGGQPIPFPAGYLFTISTDVAKAFLHNTIIKDNEGIDDRCVGFILKDLGISIINISDNNYMVQSSKDVTDICTKLENKKIFMIRIRHFKESPDTKFGIDVSDRFIKDLAVHNQLYDKFYRV